MDERQIKIIKNWREQHPRFAFVDQAFHARNRAFLDFAASVTTTLRPHFEELEIPIRTSIEAHVWRDILTRIPQTDHNYYRVGVIEMSLEAIEADHEFFDEMLILEEMCRYEIRVLDAWPIFAERFHDYQPHTQEEFKLLAIFTVGRAFPLENQPVPEIDQTIFTREYLTELANAAKEAAESRLAHPERENHLRLHQKFHRAQKLYQFNKARIVKQLTEELSRILCETHLLPPPDFGPQLLKAFLERHNPLDVDSVMALALQEAVDVIPPGPERMREAYEAALWAIAPRLKNYLRRLARPIRSLADVSEN